MIKKIQAFLLRFSPWGQMIQAGRPTRDWSSCDFSKFIGQAQRDIRSVENSLEFQLRVLALSPLKAGDVFEIKLPKRMSTFAIDPTVSDTDAHMK